MEFGEAQKPDQFMAAGKKSKSLRNSVPLFVLEQAACAKFTHSAL
jgi:hypothetical protein